jgi:small-conductance mechanosensitive channel
VGYAVALVVRWVVRFALTRLRFDPLVERTGITGSLRGLGVRTPLSQILSQTVFLLLLLSFMITATRLMALDAVAELLQDLLRFLPNMIAALIIFLLGGIVAQFVGDLITTAGLGSGLQYAGRIGNLIRYLISLFVVILALGQLGLDTGILVTALTIVIAAFGLALGLALGLGARSIVLQILAGYYIRQQFPAGRIVTVGDVRGEIRSVSGVHTVIATDDSQVVVPNTLLLETIVQTSQPPSPPTSS